MKTRHAQPAELCTNPVARKLLHLMGEKQTNLAVAADVTSSRELLSLADLFKVSTELVNELPHF